MDANSEESCYDRVSSFDPMWFNQYTSRLVQEFCAAPLQRSSDYPPDLFLLDSERSMDFMLQITHNTQQFNGHMMKKQKGERSLRNAEYGVLGIALARVVYLNHHAACGAIGKRALP